MKKKIEVKISEKKKSDWIEILEMLVNQDEIGFLKDSDDTIRMYPDNEGCWSFVLTKDGRWYLE